METPKNDGTPSTEGAHVQTSALSRSSTNLSVAGLVGSGEHEPEQTRDIDSSGAQLATFCLKWLDAGENELVDLALWHAANDPKPLSQVLDEYRATPVLSMNVKAKGRAAACLERGDASMCVYCETPIWLGRVELGWHYRTAVADDHPDGRRRLAVSGEQSSTWEYVRTAADCHVDHINPTSLGGLDVLDNWALSCAHCNTSKGARTIGQWLAGKTRRALESFRAEEPF